MTKDEVRLKCYENYALSEREIVLKRWQRHLKDIRSGNVVVIDSSTLKWMEQEALEMIKKNEGSIEALKNGKWKVTKPVNMCPPLKNLTPGKGYLRLLQAIAHLSSVKRPTGSDIKAYLNLKYGLTGHNTELMKLLTLFKLIENDKGYYVTDFGHEMLKAYGCDE